MTPSHHILCAGSYSVPFARLAAHCLLETAAQVGISDLRLYIHLDGMDRVTLERSADWLGSVRGLTLTQGLFGVRAGEKIPGKWHQKMVNRVASVFAMDPALAIVDADFFLADTHWWEIAQQAADPSICAISYNIRPSRTLTVRGTSYHPHNTILFTLRPSLHQALNTQMDSQSRGWIKGLAAEFPGALLDLQENVDSMLQVSLRAQALGYKMVDLGAQLGGCHIGGFSHFKPDKFSAKTPDRRRVEWIQRLRLLRLVVAYMDQLGWTAQIDPAHRQKMREASDLIAQDPVLSGWMTSTPPSPDETAWPLIPSLLSRQGASATST